MAKRNEHVNQISVTDKTHDRFMSYDKYNSNKEGILIMIMDGYDKYLAIINHKKKES